MLIAGTMIEFELSQEAQHWLNAVLIWIGFGTLAGLLALVVLPVRRPTGPVSALLLGVSGSMVGLCGLSLAVGEQGLNPIGPIGFLAATAGAFLLLVLYRAVCALLERVSKE